MRRIFSFGLLWVFCLILVAGCAETETKTDRPESAKRPRVPSASDVKQK
jgi:hypothetical protein